MVKYIDNKQCNSTSALYQFTSENVHRLQDTLHKLPNIDYQATDRYCPLFEYPWEDFGDDNIYISSLVTNWKSNAKLFNKSIKYNRASIAPSKVYIRVVGLNKLGLSIQLVLNKNSNQWLIDNILEVKRPPSYVLGADNNGITTYSINFIGIENELFDKNEYWRTLYDIDRGLKCKTQMSQVESLSSTGMIHLLSLTITSVKSTLHLYVFNK